MGCRWVQRVRGNHADDYSYEHRHHQRNNDHNINYFDDIKWDQQPDHDSDEHTINYRNKQSNYHYDWHNDWLAHPEYDDYWRHVSVEQRFDDVRAPAVRSNPIPRLALLTFAHR